MCKSCEMMNAISTVVEEGETVDDRALMHFLIRFLYAFRVEPDFIDALIINLALHRSRFQGETPNQLH